MSTKWYFIKGFHRAGVAELADARDLKSRDESRTGSTPVTGTTSEGANTVPFPPNGENCTMLAPSSFPNRTRSAGLRLCIAKGLAMTNLSIKKLNRDETLIALNLVWNVFLEYEAPDYTSEGIETFYKSIHEENYLSMLSVYGAFIGEELVGVIATRNGGKHIALFFVEGKYHRQGIGKQLFQAVQKEEMTVNSSLYAVPIYHRLGFKDTGTEQAVNGVRFIPMELRRCHPCNG